MGELEPRRCSASTATSLAQPSSLPVGRLTVGTLLFTAAGWIELAVEGGSSPLMTATMIACLAASLALLWSAASGNRSLFGRKIGASRVGRAAAVAALALSAVVSLSLATGLALTNEPSHAYGSDAAAFNHYNAQLVLDGVNPYTADNRFWDAVAEFPNAGATPLRRGLYADSQFGPSLNQLVRDVRAEIDQPSRRGPEFAPASLHSYPALAFLIDTPALALGFTTTLPISLLALIGFLWAAAWAAPKGSRLLVWLLVLANPILVLLTLRGSFDIVALLPALLAWRTLDRRWLSPILLGVACAVKQIVWPLVPFYAILVWRRDGPRETVRRLALAGVAFLIPNAPFALASPVAWARSLFLPMTLPIFPSGIGVVSLSRAGMLPLLPSTFYGLFELAALVALLVWFARARPALRPELALILGLLPYLLAWHSATTYFAAIPALAVSAVVAARREDAWASSHPTSARAANVSEVAMAVASGTTPT